MNTTKQLTCNCVESIIALKNWADALEKDNEELRIKVNMLSVELEDLEKKKIPNQEMPSL